MAAPSSSSPSQLSNVDLSSEFFTDADSDPSASLLHSSAGALQPAGGTLSSATGAATSAGALGPAPGQDESRTARLCAFLSVDYYRPYFDVDTATVVGRIKSAATPGNQDVFASTQEAGPDLYGPFWVASALIFFIAGESNFNAYLAHSSGKWERDFTLLSLAATMIYVYVFVIPICIWVFARSSGVSVSLVKVVSLYGYALSSFIVASFLCIIPASWLQWIVVLLAMGLSGSVLFQNLRGLLFANIGLDVEAQGESGPKRSMTAALMTAMLLHFVFALLLKLFFFQGADFASGVPAGNAATSAPETKTL